MAECEILLEVCQKQGEKREHAFNWTLFLAHRWLADRPYALAAAVRPSRLDLQTGLEYASSGGQSNGKAEPRWKVPAAVGDEVREQKGSLTWTAQALSNTSLRERIQTSVWTPPGVDITVDDESKTDTPGLQETRCSVASIVLGTYDIVNEIVTTTAGNEYIGILRITIE